MGLKPPEASDPFLHPVTLDAAEVMDLLGFSPEVGAQMAATDTSADSRRTQARRVTP
jgi:hypothetical protein